MFNYKSSITGKIDRKKLWEIYANPQQWPQWDFDLETATLDGPFKEGSTGMLYMKNMPPLGYTLESVVEKESFVNTAVLGGISVTFGHSIEKQAEGTLKVTHTITVNGEVAEEKLQGIGRGISASLEENMERLGKLVALE